jgi:hypothetical protein
MNASFFTASDGSLCRTQGHPITVREHYAWHHTTIRSGREFRETLRAGAYTWPGGYPLYFITSDGAALSFKSARENYAHIVRSIRDRANDGWRIVGCDVNYEDPDLYCDHSGERIESAYAED